MNHRFERGQKVDYFQMAFGCENGYGEPERVWMSGYTIVLPVSPYNPCCILIMREGNGSLSKIPFNAEPAHVRPAYVKQKGEHHDCNVNRSSRKESQEQD